MGRAVQPFGARTVLETGAPVVVKEVEVNRVLIFSALFLSLLLGGCYIVTPFILNNGTESPIVLLVADELDRDTHRLKSLSTRRILPGNWSEEFGAYRPALFVFDEGKNELFAYDLGGAGKAFFLNGTRSCGGGHVPPPSGFSIGKTAHCPFRVQKKIPSRRPFLL